MNRYRFLMQSSVLHLRLGISLLSSIVGENSRVHLRNYHFIMSLSQRNKGEWPELKGKRTEEAGISLFASFNIEVQKIRQDRPDVVIQTIPVGSIITLEFRSDRVRVTADDNDVVVSVPKVG